MAQSLFITLAERYPGCEIDVVSPEWSLPVLHRMPQVRQGVALAVTHGEFSLMKRFKLGRSLAGTNYTHAIVLPRSWKSALLPFFANVPVRTGYKGEMRYGLLNDMRALDRTLLSRTVQRYVALAYPPALNGPPATPFPALRTDNDNTRRLLDEFGLNRSRPVIGIMPGAEYGPAKQWPAEYYAALSSGLVQAGYQVWAFGSAKERELGHAIFRGIPEHARNLCGVTQLEDVIDLVACVQQVVSNDSGLMHVAAAVGVKVNVIYGSSTPAYTPPLSDNATIFYKALDCSPCFDRRCRFQHYNCLKQIEPDEVIKAIVSA